MAQGNSVHRLRLTRRHFHETWSILFITYRETDLAVWNCHASVPQVPDVSPRLRWPTSLCTDRCSDFDNCPFAVNLSVHQISSTLVCILKGRTQGGGEAACSHC